MKKTTALINPELAERDKQREDAKLMAECEKEELTEAQAEQKLYTIRNASFGLNRKNVRELKALLKVRKPSRHKLARIKALQKAATDAVAARAKAVNQLRDEVRS